MKFSLIPTIYKAYHAVVYRIAPLVEALARVIPFCFDRLDDEGRIEGKESGKISRSRDQTEWMARLANPLVPSIGQIAETDIQQNGCVHVWMQPSCVYYRGFEGEMRSETGETSTGWKRYKGVESQGSRQIFYFGKDFRIWKNFEYELWRILGTSVG